MVTESDVFYAVSRWPAQEELRGFDSREERDAFVKENNRTWREAAMLWGVYLNRPEQPKKWLADVSGDTEEDVRQRHLPYFSEWSGHPSEMFSVEPGFRCDGKRDFF